MLAVTEIGLSPQEFWDLSWYDWALYVMRHQKHLENEEARIKMSWKQVRTLLAVIVNHSFSPPKTPMSPDDFLDKPQGEQEQENQPPEESFKEMKKRLGSRIKHGK